MYSNVSLSNFQVITPGCEYEALKKNLYEQSN